MKDWPLLDRLLLAVSVVLWVPFLTWAFVFGGAFVDH